MKRRRLIAIISICILVAAGLVAVGGVWVIMRTDFVRSTVESRLAGAVNGSVYVGRISGNPFSGITIDSVAIRDKTGELFLSAGHVVTDYDVRDVMDTRLFLRHLVASHPYLHFRQYANGDWNYRRIFRKGPTGAKRTTPARSWGDYIVLDSVRAIDGTFILSLNWAPDDTLRGRARDSVIKHELARTDRDMKKTADGYARTYTWTHGTLLLPHVRLFDPDSNRFGRTIQIASLDADESDPPFRFRKVKGNVKVLGDSVWLDLAHWDLPASTGSATGKIVWGSGLPIRYDIAVRGDSVALNDVNWVYPTLPKIGGGKLLLHIGNKRDLHVMEYKLTQLDMRSAGSHLTGEMTFGVGQPILQVRNVNLTANPLDFEFIHTLNGKPLPIDWRGQIYGSVRASGGPLTDFEVDAAHGEWRDAHVPGAVSRFSGSGGLDILRPLFTTFHDFQVDVGSLDLRSIEYLFPAFPLLTGTISGKATLDSIWTDVRFRDAEIFHRDGPGKPSRFLGSGRITDGKRFITYDVSLLADSLSFTTLARSPVFSSLKLRGMAAGPIAIRGQTPELQITTRLSGPAGMLAYSGTVDLDSLGGYSARGRGEFARLNLRELLTNPRASLTSLTGRYDLDVRGSSARTLTGQAALKLDRSKIDSAIADSASNALVRFANGRVSLSDTVRVMSPMGRLTAIGSLGLSGETTVDSIHVTLDVASLSSLRPLFGAAGDSSKADSLGGKLLVNGVAVGNIDSLLLAGTIAGENLYVRGISTPQVSGTFSIANVLHDPHGVIDAAAKRVTAGGLEFDTMAAHVNVADSAHGSYTLNGGGRVIRNLALAAGGSWSIIGATTAARLDSLSLVMADSRWALALPATITFDSSVVRVDSLDLRNGKGGSIGIAGIVPAQSLVDLRVSGSRVPLADINRVMGRVRAPVSGLADLVARVGGTRDRPTIVATTTLDSIAISDVRIGRLLATARYANERAGVDLGIYQGEMQVLRATADSLPLSISFSGFDTLPGRVRASATADSADFTLIQAFVQGVSNVTGKVSGILGLDGTWAQPNLTAKATLAGAGMRIDTLGITLSNLAGGVTYARDTLRVDSLRAQSGGPRNTGSVLTGSFVAFEKWSPSWFNIEMDMRDFEAYNRPELATVFARTDSGPVRLFGSFARDSLKGIINVDAGAIYLPDPKLVGKTFSQQLADVTDTLGFGLLRARDTSLYDRITRNLSTDLNVHLGGTFKLSADNASVPLSGDLRIVPVTIATPVAGRAADDIIARLAPEGTINADGGRYTVDLLPLRVDFNVERGSTIFFDRNPDWNGVLNIAARHTVRPRGRPDVPIIVDVTDHLLTPKVSLRSDAAYPISQSDLLSYLMFGEPGFDLLGQSSNRAPGRQAENLVASLLSPLVTSVAAEQLRRSVLGKWVDQLRLEAANPNLTTDQTNVLSYLYNTRLAGDKEIVKDRVYLNFSTGLCGFNPSYRTQVDQGFAAAVREQLGLGAEWRFKSTLHTGSSAQVASEPSTQALLCSSGGAGLRGVAPTPRQYSLSFLKFWRW